MQTKRHKTILLVEKWACPNTYMKALEKFNCTDHMEYRVVHVKPTDSLDSVDLNPWGDEADQVTSITTIFGSGLVLTKLLDIHKNVKWINALSVGVDWILQPPFTSFPREGLVLTNIKGALSEAVSEYTIFMMLMHEKGAVRFMKQQEQSLWQVQPVGRLAGKSVAIIGFGDIGGHLAAKCKLGFGMKVIGFKRNPSTVDEKYQAFADQVLGLESLGEILPDVDYVVSILPGVGDTKHFWTYDRFSMMKPSAFFINIGRGANVNENDLIRALQEKKIAGTYLDVTEVEPLPTSSPLWKMENVYLTPHSCCYTVDVLDNAMRSYFANVIRFVKGESLQNQVSIEKGY